MTLYQQLREKHKKFIYHSYEFTSEGGSTVLRFHFSIDEFEFRPQWSFPFDIPESCDRALIDRIAFSLGMAELVSYWKCACCPEVEIRCGSLSEWQKQWWKKLYFNGLGEFFYRNGITPDFSDFMSITAVGAAPDELSDKSPRNGGVLVPVGGGKDSVVSLELLKKHGCDIYPYIINPRGTTLDCVKAAGIPESRTVGVHRTIDKTLLELNKRGYLNGHTPFSAVVAFSAELFAAAKGLRYIALSNESSANEPYVDGTSINHQYSKSTEFEGDFREYCDKSFGGFSRCPEYFSLLRPWSEWQIAREFVKYPQYFGVFKSCNLGSKTDVWCGECAKCLYVYILLSAFLDDNQLTEIFGCNMLEKQHLAEMFDGLVLDGEDKPFECVGTRDEIRLSLDMALKLRGENLPALLRRYKSYDRSFSIHALSDYYDSDNFVPDEFIYLLKGE
ncbi:MAG: hypothetical protein ACI4KA_06055 [Oscillospiraceae bacterium]